jgi:hypothetical protein
MSYVVVRKLHALNYKEIHPIIAMQFNLPGFRTFALPRVRPGRRWPTAAFRPLIWNDDFS